MTGALRRTLLAQAEACAELGSPMYAELLTRAADDPGTAVADVLGDRTGPGFVLGMLGTVHRLVLEGRAPDLAAHYPTAGGTKDPLAAWPAFRDALAEHAPEVRAGLADPPQTNEVGRAAPLVGGLLTVAAATGLPVRLLELGASAGLNLRADHFRITYEGGAYGPVSGAERRRSGGNRPPVVPPEDAAPETGVVLADAWRGLPRVDARLVIVERRGCDLNPLDPASPEARRRLLSYVWPDQAARVARLRAAFAVAERVPATVVRAGAAEFLDGVAPREGVATVVWHSTMQAYLSPDESARVHARLEQAGAAATADAPFAHLSFEGPDASRLDAAHVLTLRLWPDGGPVILAEGPSHGLPTTWR
ncbi:DUF2332 domain-containing protein [Actinomadura decatromicini]|uniref:DUF2332 domain-containing protein n=1 Tax=Actinomadura decatromicini TaxID=2604572 RepID=A0A5D3FG24_9ACTN|nr:DUF2332 domain-containing protein [Actinomadura decatromicini]TYK47867.1 DUF2332 domain-containing protein [Actinomadura decatromicini]